MSTIPALGLLLLVVMVLVGGKQGALSFLSLLLNFIFLFAAIVLVSLHFSPMVVTLIFGVVILAVTIFLGNDDEVTTQTAFFASILVMLVLLALILPVEHWASVQGFGMEDSDDLEGMSLLIGIKFMQVSIVTAVFSTLGAIAEAAMAISAGLAEIVQQQPKIATKQLFYDGITVGKQIIGTTFNTLFFGFFGGFLGLFIWYVDLHYSLGQFLNNKIFDAEILMVLFSLISVILTVPMTTWVMTRRIHRVRKNKRAD
ncbi:YibE/F family protein [Loigolactobacillus iwatensis]|uniref:YibE/F family protein n=1 Tax=Loigolactobacillus iwatensis TaxID=1267156 RepID=UPI000F7F82FF|nr:YibE/F family protein [Loigolactobacillus iwatensis]